MGYPPVIIIGMHRSGTSILARILEDLGVFMGARKESNDEAIFFLRLNEWIFRQVNATWDNPYNFRFVDEYFIENIAKIVKNYISTKAIKDFLGWSFYFKYRRVENLDIKWGWKDPRNTFTIDIWRKIFDNIKVIHIYRNPIDVAESLRNREKNMERHSVDLVRLKNKDINCLLKLGIYDSLRVLNIHEGIKLWFEYVTKALYLTEDLGNSIIHIKYEDVCLNPVANILKIADFLDIEERKDVSKIAEKIYNEQVYAFLKKSELVQIYYDIKDHQIMKRLGYNFITKDL